MHRLLLIEDEEGIRLAVGEFLRQRGYAVDCAAHREAAEGMLAKRVYACVIADLRLAGESADAGLRLVASARRLQPQSPVIVLTGLTDPWIEERAARLGVAEFLVKPTPLAHLAHVVERLLVDAS